MLRSYPAMVSGSWDLERPGRRIRRLCEERGIPFLALEPGFRELTRRGRALHWKLDGHWNAEGNDEAARAIAPFARSLSATGQPRVSASTSASKSPLPAIARSG